MSQQDRLNVIEMRWLRAILGVQIMDFMPNIEIRLICGSISEVSSRIEVQRLKYFGHIVRSQNYDPDCLQSRIYRWVKPEGWAQPRGRPPSRWIDGVARGLSKFEDLLKEVKVNKRQGKRPPGRPRRSHIQSRVVSHWIIDWTLVESAAHLHDEWRNLTLTLENYNFEKLVESWKLFTAMDSDIT